MLSLGLRMAVAVTAAMGATLTAAVPAAAQIDPTPIDCEDEPTAVECEDDVTPPEGDDAGPGAPRTCTFNGAEVPCTTSYGHWVGDVVDGEWYGLGGDVWPAILVGCWATATATDRSPPTTYDGPAESGAWYTLSCLGPGGAYPSPGPTQFDLAWRPASEGEVDPEELARRALASITLGPPQLVLSPPETGSVPFRMPLWLAVDESEQTWGPISSGEYCEQGLCVEVAAEVVHIDWEMGDGNTVRCLPEQNVQWQRGMDFLNPGNACHHYYSSPSRHEPDGRYQLSATATWRAEWSGGGQSGVFDDVTDACGADSDELCQSATTVEVVEIQVLVT